LFAINPTPTPYDELNGLLVELTMRAHEILGENFVGAYLQGSFAVGDADEASDCDFLIPVRRQVTGAQESALRAMHAEFPSREGYWPGNIEGSYPPAEELRTLDALERRWLYIDRGLTEMQWSTHCNSEVVRWSLRECGITLAGPEPKTLVDEVSGDVLRAKMRELIPGLLPSMTWVSLDICWGQRYAVTTLCRMLQTLESGRVTSKRAALLWGRERLEARWRPLVDDALENRHEQWDNPTRAGAVEETRAFAAWASDRAAGT
jgi:hypothetical protein